VHQQVVDQIVRHPNVYTDTSSVREFDYIVQAVRRAGPHKVLFGSDGPWLHPGVEIHKIRLLRLPAAQEALILGGNILRLMRRALVGRGAAQIPRPCRTHHSAWESNGSDRFDHEESWSSRELLMHPREAIRM
jgi:hypothetical protein